MNEVKTEIERDDWRHTKLNLLKILYAKQAEIWGNLYPPVHDDRRLFINIYNQIVEAVSSLSDNPNITVCVAMNRYIKEEQKTLDAIKMYFVGNNDIKEENNGNT